MLSLARNGYEYEQVRRALHGLKGQQMMSFRYDLLDKNEVKIKELVNVLSGEVSCDSNANIKRTAKFSIQDDGTINFLSDRIQPFALLKMPDGGTVEFPLGIFLLSSPTRYDSEEQVFRAVNAYDGLIILKEDKFDHRFTVTAGTNYRAVVIDILLSAGITKHNIQFTDKVLEKDLDFEPGVDKLFVINELLKQINFNPIHVDVLGFFTSSIYRNPSIRAADYTYKDDEESVTLPGMEEGFDLSKVPNEFVVIRSNSEQYPLRSVYINDNPHSPVSTVNLNRKITYFEEVSEIADQESLDEYTQKVAFNASQIYGTLTFNTAIMPHHGIDNVLAISYSRLGINEKYVESSWSFPLKAGGIMRHEVRRVISI